VFGEMAAVQSNQPPSVGAATLAGPAEALRSAMPLPGRTSKGRPPALARRQQ